MIAFSIAQWVRSGIFAFFAIGTLFWLIRRLAEARISDAYHSVDAVVPAYNEELVVHDTVMDLIKNRYINQVICVDDGSTDRTAEVLDDLCLSYSEKVIVVRKSNGGKASALNEGLKYVTSDLVFFTDADTRIPNDDGIGRLIVQIHDDVVAADGISGSNLGTPGLLPRIRATVKVPVILLLRCGMSINGKAPFCISGACGLYRTDVVREVGVPDRTGVEDLDLTWTLVERGYKVGQSARCVVFTQESRSIRTEIRRWRRWTAGYGACMRLHRSLLWSRFGLLVIAPMAVIGVFGGLMLYVLPATIAAANGTFAWWLIAPPSWLVAGAILSLYSARICKDWTLVFYSPLSVLILLIALGCWIVWGIPALITGKEPSRDKPPRYQTPGTAGKSPYVGQGLDSAIPPDYQKPGLFGDMPRSRRHEVCRPEVPGVWR